MKKIVPFFILLLVFALLISGCSNNEEILQRLETLESQVALINETIGEADASTGAVSGQTTDPTSSLTTEPSPTPEPKTVLSYETITDVLGKANVMAGLEDKFLYGEIWVSGEESFIFLTYDCTLSEEVLDVINQNLRQSYDGSEFSGSGNNFSGDGDLISFSENDNNTLSIGFELSSMETASKLYQLDEEYFPSYEDFKMSQDVLNEYGLPEPTHGFNFEEDGSISTSLSWELSEEQAKQLAVYYAALFSTVDSEALAETEINDFEAEGYADDGTRIIFTTVYYGETFGTMIKHIYKEA